MVACQHGFKLFVGEGSCFMRHTGPYFSDGKFKVPSLRGVSRTA